MIPTIIWPFVAAFWIFVLWILWIVSKTVKSIDASLKDIARSLQSQSKG
jgi:fructose-specific phosphotransferase system IIC component